MYKRVVLKMSGEQFSGEHEFGINTKIGKYLAHECEKVVKTGCQLIVIVGGGNLVRGANVAGDGIKRVTADQMGMLSGLINALALTDIFESIGLDTRCMSSVFAEQVSESYSYKRAIKHLENGRIVIIAGGIARPYFTHDSAAVSLGLELDCQMVIKATKVDGVYDKDPAKFPGAKRIKKMDYQKAVADSAIGIMDKAALGLALEHEIPITILDAMKKDNILRSVMGESIGTYIG